MADIGEILECRFGTFDVHIGGTDYVTARSERIAEKLAGLLRHRWFPIDECGELADGDYIGKHNLTTSEVSLTRSKLRGGHWEGFAPDEILSPSLGPIPEVSR